MGSVNWRVTLHTAYKPLLKHFWEKRPRARRWFE